MMKTPQHCCVHTVCFIRQIGLTGLLLGVWLAVVQVQAAEPSYEVIDLWPGLAPGEMTQNVGEALPRRETEMPLATRIKSITRPQLRMYAPPVGARNGVAVLIFPGGGYSYVVADKEGSEAAEWLASLGVTAFVVHYRTKESQPREQQNPVLPPFSERPLQDGQRAVSLVRQRADEWGLDPERIGVLGFSAGGQAAALVTTRFDERSYERVDGIDEISCRPDFSMLVYPWRLIDDASGQLSHVLIMSPRTPPTFLVHTHDDGATSLGSVLFYAGLKQHKVSCELHIYATGGHGYGMRPVENSDVDTWTDRAEDWLQQRALISRTQPSESGR